MHCEPGRLVVDSGAGEVMARQAASCLLLPEAGDTVACMTLAEGDVWVLAVLHRDPARAQVLQCRGDTRLEVSNGRLTLDAADIRMHSERLGIDSRSAVVSTDTGEFIGKQLRVVSSTVKVVGSVLSTVMDRVNLFSRNYLRTTEGLDRVAAAHIECEAEQLLRLKGEHALVEGARLIKARGAQIHFG